MTKHAGLKLRTTPKRPTNSCTVCGGRIGNSWFSSEFGDVWCESHRTEGQCAWCGVPNRNRAGDRSNCASCGDNVVSTRLHVDTALRQVGARMARLGLSVTHPTRLVLRPPETLRSSGLFDLSPDQLGVTRWLVSDREQPVGEITIGIASGLPLPQFRRVLAHEYAHALLVGYPTARLLDLRIVEGFAESVAAHELKSTDGRLEMILLRRMRRNPDPVYGGGYRAVDDAISRHGMEPVFDALRCGAPTRVGLA